MVTFLLCSSMDNVSISLMTSFSIESNLFIITKGDELHDIFCLPLAFSKVKNEGMRKFSFPHLQFF